MLKNEITAGLVACLVREQVPALGDEPVVPVDVDGWDNSSFRVGSDHVARLPTAEGYVPAVAKEHAWLPVLRQYLPVAIPEPVVLGAPGCGFPRPWSLYRWLPGETAAHGRVADLVTFALDVAGVLTALQAVEPGGGPAAGEHSSGRGGPLSVYDADVRRCLAALPPDVDRDAVALTWQAALSTRFEGPPRWFHGDVAPSNLLVRGGRLSAVIDFGTCGVGDPACDLALAWTFFDHPARAAFRGAMAVNDGTWARGRAWALWKALLTLEEPDGAAAVHRYGWRYEAADVVRNAVTEGGAGV